MLRFSPLRVFTRCAYLVGMTLDEFKTDQRLSLTELASLLGFPVSTVAGWLDGRRRPDIGLLAEIATATGGAVSPAELRPDLACIIHPSPSKPASPPRSRRAA